MNLPFRTLGFAAAGAIALFLFMTLAPREAEAATAEVASPSGDIVVSVSDDGGTARYAVSFRGEKLIAPSRLGMIFRDKPGFDGGLEIVSVDNASHDETWEQPWGERHFVRDHHNEILVEFASVDDSGRRSRALPSTRTIGASHVA